MVNTTLRNGDHGQAVRDLQRQLIVRGAQIVPDGWFGDATEAAVAAFQTRSRLVVDGLAGSKTLQALASGQVSARTLGHADLERAAVQLGVDVASIYAVNQTESRGCGFLEDGRAVILYERHIMYARLQQTGADVATLAARYPNLVNPQRGGYAGGTAEYVRLKNARNLDDTCAIESASWGLFQIMGFHWQALGYASAQAFMDAMNRSEGDQLDAFVRFILADADLLKALQARKWADFARRYNGPEYKTNLYDVKLARAYEQFSKVAA